MSRVVGSCEAGLYRGVIARNLPSEGKDSQVCFKRAVMTASACDACETPSLNHYSAPFMFAPTAQEGRDFLRPLIFFVGLTRTFFLLL
jgi:hypothetical protein